jgi:hypothetical protein
MDYGKILSRAWEITWRWKVLWILGFLAGLGSGGGGGGGGSYSGDGSEFGRIPPELIALIFALACVAILIAIAIWVVSVIARGGLIAGVQQVEDEGSTTFGQAWRVGASRFWTLFGVGILAAIPFIILLFAGIIVLVLIFAGSGLAFDSSGALGGLGIATGVVCGGAFCCGMIILAIVLEQIRIYAERAAVLEGLGWIEAFKRGWDVLKANIGPTIVFWIIFFVIGVILFFIIATILIAAFVPFIAMFATTDPGAWWAVPICCGGIIAIIVGALLSAIIQTFSSATWTLAYREMTGMAVPAAELVAEPVEEQ